MKLYNIGSGREKVSLVEAIFQGLATDGSLFMPLGRHQIEERIIREIQHYTWPEIALEIAHTLIGKDIPETALRDIIEKSLNFPVPLTFINDDTAVLELFHGPTMAFKDFGARFMAGLMNFFLKERKEKLHILVATSGDTGGAVAAGFHKTSIKVSILYPSGKISPLQEQQLTTWGDNIEALEIEGTFDDCQALVKKAFTDPDLRHLSLSSANSINIARLIPQSFYYFEAYRQAKQKGCENVVFSVPCGNFGNLTAGLWAKKMGLPVQYFLAATNINRVVPDYLRSGIFTPKKSIPTLSNAMDVGNPSNFSRMLEFYSSTWNKFGKNGSTWNHNTKEEAKFTPETASAQGVWKKLREEIKGFSFTDAETLQGINTFRKRYNYLFDPHGTIAMMAWEKEKQKNLKGNLGIVLETAHPAKFMETIKMATGTYPEIPEQLKSFMNKEKKSHKLQADYKALKAHLLST